MIVLLVSALKSMGFRREKKGMIDANISEKQTSFKDRKSESVCFVCASMPFLFFSSIVLLFQFVLLLNLSKCNLHSDSLLQLLNIENQYQKMPDTTTTFVYFNKRQKLYDTYSNGEKTVGKCANELKMNEEKTERTQRNHPN